MSLHGARGEMNGVLLTDETILRLSPESASGMVALLQPGRPVVARGDELSPPKANGSTIPGHPARQRRNPTG
jgi:hypothetical protein